jgi:hypothetical protein
LVRNLISNHFTVLLRLKNCNFYMPEECFFQFFFIIIIQRNISKLISGAGDGYRRGSESCWAACQVVLGNAREIGERVGMRLDTASKLCKSISSPADEIAEVFLDEVPGMVEAFGNGAKRSHLLPSTAEHGVSPPQSGTIHLQRRRNRYG